MTDVDKIVAEMKEDARLHVSIRYKEILPLIAEYERLKGIVDKLPKTKDGAIIQLGMPAWIQAVPGPLPMIVETMEWENGSVLVNDYEPGDLYSTKAAALLASAEKGDGQ